MAPAPYNYPITFQINTDWAVLNILTPGVTIRVVTGSDETTVVDGNKLSWGIPLKFGSHIFSLIFESQTSISTVQLATEHGWDSIYSGDHKGQIVISSNVDKHSDRWTPESDAKCHREYPLNLPAPFAFPEPEE